MDEKQHSEILSKKVRARASFDLSCPKNKLKVNKIDKSTFGAVGCGKKASYIPNESESCRSNAIKSELENNCNMKLDGQVQKYPKI